ncbi:MAG TPA: hypothetical protein VGA70_03000 [Longimicrobiales bacterium]
MSLLLVTLASMMPGPAQAQIELRNLVFTGGFSVEGYGGNLSAVTVPLVDSTDHAQAAIGEFGARGSLLLRTRYDGERLIERLVLDFDAGLRQFAARGFELRDYAPREWAARTALTWERVLGHRGTMTLTGSARSRDVEDRPPMPLFLQPGYLALRAGAYFETNPIQGVSFDAGLTALWSDYDAIELLSQLDLLDHRTQAVELGANTGRGVWDLRFYGGVRRALYPHQESFDVTDPYRRDVAFHMGTHWTYLDGVSALLGVEGTINRSNSKRPEYDAVSVTGQLVAPLPWWQTHVSLFAVLTGKTYVHETDFARLVPGEEADNASQVYLQLTRPVAPNLDGSVRFGWARAETDIGRSYFSRFGASVLLDFRPGG